MDGLLDLITGIRLGGGIDADVDVEDPALLFSVVDGAGLTSSSTSPLDMASSISTSSLGTSKVIVGGAGPSTVGAAGASVDTVIPPDNTPVEEVAAGAGAAFDTACRGIDGEDGMNLAGEPIPNLDIPPTLPGLDPNPGDEGGRNIPKVDGDRTNPGVVGGRKRLGVVLPLIPAAPAPAGRREEGVAIGILEIMGKGVAICFGGVISIESSDWIRCRSGTGGDTSGVVDCFPPETRRIGCGCAGRSSVAVADALSCFLGGVGGRATTGEDGSMGDSSSSSSTYMR
jgi:hypothetical protein